MTVFFGSFYGYVGCHSSRRFLPERGCSPDMDFAWRAVSPLALLAARRLVAPAMLWPAFY
jgi:hypothetical protein